MIANKFGRYFEDFIDGETIDHKLRKTITESDNNLFCLLTMNHHPVHLDVEYAKATHYGKILVVGTLVLSIIVGMTVPDISGKAIANLDYEVNHCGPVFIGDTLHARSIIVSKRESKSKSDRGIVGIKTIAYNQNDEIVLTLCRHILVPKER